MPTSIATITPMITQKAVWLPSPGTPTFMPQMLATSVSGSTITLIEVRTRRMSLTRWLMTDSFVASRASTVSF